MFTYFAVLIGALALSYLLRPKPQQAPPPGINEVKVPTAETGRPIPVLFGTKEIKGINTVGYWNIRIIPIRKSGGKK